MIDAITNIVIPIADQERAIDFYRGTLGFELRADHLVGPGVRWVELGLPGATTTIALVPPREGMWSAIGQDSNVSLGCAGIDDEHRRLRDAGVDVDDNVLDLGHGVPKMFRFRDPDGNTIQVVEHP
jgi:catechol 2,3-dioxygenase-like lactoylglutathione lyase family enzyme